MVGEEIHPQGGPLVAWKVASTAAAPKMGCSVPASFR